MPFEIARVYYLIGTKPGVERGFHAHRALRQLMVSVSGSCTVLLDDGRHCIRIKLDRPNLALEICGLVWREMRDFTFDSVVMVLANAPYDESDYIREYNRFLEAVQV